MRAKRPAFTILELLLAILIAALLLAALYAVMNMTMQQTQSSRSAVESEDLARGIFNKLSLDLSGTLAPLPPKSGGNSAASGGTSTAATPSTTATTPATTTTDPATSTAPTGGSVATTPSTTTTDGSTDTTTAGATDNATAVAADYATQGGIIGRPDEKKLVIYAGRVPEAFGRYGNPGEQVRADQRQIIYQLVDGRGLYRQERPWITADGVRDGIELDVDSPDAVLIAEEATDFVVEYSDGSSWVTEWDGTALGPDGVSRLGPPRAVRVTVVLTVPTGKSGQTAEKRVTQVIAIRAAPGTYTPPLVEAPTDGATDTTGGTTSGTTGGTTGGSTGGATGGSTGGTTGGSTGGATGGSTGGATGGSTGGATGGSAGSSGSARPSTGGSTGGSSGGSTGASAGGKAGGR